MLFFIENKSSVVTPAQLACICEAMNRALVMVTSAWGFKGAIVETPADAVTCDAWITIIDDDPSKQGELGDHDEEHGEPLAVILAKVVTDAGGGVLDGGSIGVSVASVIAHEVYETLVDLNVNDWIFDGKNFLAKEVCDPVEGAPSFAVQLESGETIELSNVVYPAYFDAQAAEGSAFDMCGAVTVPFQLLGGGYQIVFDVDQRQEVQVFGASRLALHEKLRAHRFARRAKRAKALEHARRRRAA